MQPSQVPSPLDFLRKFLILFLQPFCQGVSTRLPFIYYVIHLDAHFGKQITDTFGSKWFPIGCFVAAFQVKYGCLWEPKHGYPCVLTFFSAPRTLIQACRIVTNVVSLYLPRFSHLTGSLAGLAGFAIVLVNDDKDNLARLPGCTSKATALADHTECISPLTGHRYRQRPPPGIHPTPSRVYKGTRGAISC